jgi:hypothetical protein
MPRYEGRDKTARFIQFAARFIVGLLARVCCLQVMCAALSFQMPRISKTLIVARVVQPYSRFSRKLDHELVDCTKKHQFPLHTFINNNKPFASTAGSWFPTFSLKQISSIEVSLICSICQYMSHIFTYSSHVFPMVSPWFPHVFLPWLRRIEARGDAVIRFREETRKLLAAMTSARRTFRLGSHCGSFNVRFTNGEKELPLFEDGV